MAAPTTFGLRRSLVAALIVALTLAGLGRALATAARPASAVGAIAGVQVPICHSEPGEGPAGPARPVSHGCCDDCALLAPAVLPAPPAPSRPAPAVHVAAHARAVAWAPATARRRDPRLSRGHRRRDLTRTRPLSLQPRPARIPRPSGPRANSRTMP